MSNLLKDASILLTPTGYDNGSMNAIKPENGDGDFTFSRNSAATRVNAQGLVENVQILSSNLVSNGDFSQEGAEEVSNGSFSQEGSQLITNGNFATDSDWGKEVGWTISNGSLVANSVTTGLAFQSNIVEANKSYKATYSVVVTSGSIGLYFDGGTGYQGIVTTTQTVTVFFNAASASPLYFRSDTSNFTGSIDNISVVEVAADWSLGTGWSVSDGVAANYDTSSNSNLSQAGSFVDGKTYKVTLEVKSYIRGVPFVSINSGASVQVPRFVGIHTMYLVAGTDATKIFRYYGGGFGSGGEGSIDNISVKEMLVTRESTTTNTGIVERAITGLNESVAFRQDTRTNLIAYSEDFNLFLNSKVDSTITSNFGVSPSGQLNSSRIQFADSTAYCYTVVSVSIDHTASVYVKGISGETIRFGIGANVVTGALFTLNGSWQRIEFTASSAAQIFFSSYSGATATDFEAFGLQLEESTQATSYIPTNGAAVTVDSNSTSVVNNTGIVERPITGVNTSDALFPDNTESTVVNISDTIIPLLTALEARATTFENREGTQNILINIQKC